MRDQKILDKYRVRSCTINDENCMGKMDPHHIRTVKTGGKDIDDNLMSLCRFHHYEIHKEGRSKFVNKYGLEAIMKLKNWEFIPYLNKWVNPNA